MDNFGNGRYVRNLIERAVQNQSVRLLAARENAEDIRKKELFLITRDDISMLEEGLKSDRSVREDSGFGNGRFVRKMLEEAEMNLAERVSQLDESMITTELITTIEERDIPEPEVKKSHKKKAIVFCCA